MTVHLLPRWFPLGGFALGESVWVLPDRPDLVWHERVHVEQQRAMGAWRFLLRYVASPTFRVRVEVVAYRAQGFSLTAMVNMLYSWVYLWCFPLGRAGIQKVVDAVLRGEP